MKKFLIERKDLPYDAFVADPSWLCPVDATEEDEKGGVPYGDQRKETDADSD